MHIGSRIKHLVENVSGMNHIDFANKIGHSEQSIHSIYKKEHINTKLLKTICQALNISVSDFFNYGEKKIELKGVRTKANVCLELDSTDILRVDMKNKTLEIIKK